MNVLSYVVALFQTGLGSLVAYLAAHVLLCLLPAFFIAGALSALIPKEAITKYLGRDAPKWISYPASALGGFVLAVCSCTIMPLFASIHKKGAGLGPAITFLFVGPAINVLAIPTWVCCNANNDRVAPTTGPVKAAMASHPSTGQTVLFGGLEVKHPRRWR